MLWRTFVQRARKMGVPLTPDQLALFRQYTALLLEANRRVNLTALRDEQALAVKFHLDALSLLPIIARHAGVTPDALRQQSWRAVDVGSGGGAPAIPLAIAWPGLRYALVESIAKKARFLEDAIAALGLHVTVLNARAEDVGRDESHRENYDLVTARAVAPLPTLAELTLPLARIDGIITLPKGPKAPEEMKAAGRAIALLGGEIAGVERAEIPDSPETRLAVILRKRAATPEGYPRRAGTPGRKPL